MIESNRKVFPKHPSICTHPANRFENVTDARDTFLQCQECGCSIAEAVKIPDDAAHGDTNWVDSWEKIMKARSAAAEKEANEKAAAERRRLAAEAKAKRDRIDAQAAQLRGAA